VESASHGPDRYARAVSTLVTPTAKQAVANTEDGPGLEPAWETGSMFVPPTTLTPGDRGVQAAGVKTHLNDTPEASLRKVGPPIAAGGLIWPC